MGELGLPPASKTPPPGRGSGRISSPSGLGPLTPWRFVSKPSAPSKSWGRAQKRGGMPAAPRAFAGGCPEVWPPGSGPEPHKPHPGPEPLRIPPAPPPPPPGTAPHPSPRPPPPAPCPARLPRSNDRRTGRGPLVTRQVPLAPGPPARSPQTRGARRPRGSAGTGNFPAARPAARSVLSLMTGSRGPNGGAGGGFRAGEAGPAGPVLGSQAAAGPVSSTRNFCFPLRGAGRKNNN